MILITSSLMVMMTLMTDIYLKHPTSEQAAQEGSELKTIRIEIVI